MSKIPESKTLSNLSNVKSNYYAPHDMIVKLLYRRLPLNMNYHHVDSKPYKES